MNGFFYFVGMAGYTRITTSVRLSVNTILYGLEMDLKL